MVWEEGKKALFAPEEWESGVDIILVGDVMASSGAAAKVLLLIRIWLWMKCGVVDLFEEERDVKWFWLTRCEQAVAADSF